MKTYVLSKNELFSAAADAVGRQLLEKNSSVLALPGGRTPQPLYAELVKRYRQGAVNFQNIKFFTVADFIGLQENDEHSTKEILTSGLFALTDARQENFFPITSENCSLYDQQIQSVCGIDLTILGLGINSHIGYNEPAIQFDSVSGVRRLTDATKKQNAAWFGSIERVPEKAVTMGIQTILKSKHIIVIAFGSEKAKAVHKMLYARNDSVVPSAFLQLHTNVDIYLDYEAAAYI